MAALDGLRLASGDLPSIAILRVMENELMFGTPRSRTTQVAARSALMLLLAATLSACTTSQVDRAPSPAKFRVLRWRPERLPGVTIPASGATFTSPTKLAFVTFGSGSCPMLPTTLATVGLGAIRLRVVEHDGPAGTSCLLDVAPTAVEIAIDPQRIDVHAPLTVFLVYPRGSVIEGSPTLHAAPIALPGL